MIGSRLAAVAIAAASVFTSVAAADLDPIVIKGSKFFYKTNGTQFFIKGVAYQQDIGKGGSTSSTIDINDPLTDTSGCKRDIPYLQKLQTNTIRVYSIDSTKSHDDCMSALADAGIYVIADLGSPATSINRDSPQWNDELYARYSGVIDTMSKYTNTLGFFAGNEVSNNASNADAIPFVKAAVRDMKAYIKTKDYRAIGVGYAADDDPSIREPLENYLNCGDSSTAIDFFGYNIYSWCGESSFSESHYEDRTKEFANYSVPAFFAEYGCNTDVANTGGHRIWQETGTLYGKSMTPVWSGGIAFEYFQAANEFGLVSVSGDDVKTLADFSALSTAIAKVTPSGVNSASYTPSHTAARDCPNSDTFPGWAAATHLPPSPNKELCACMVKNLTCVAKSSVKTAAYGALFDVACDPENGADICAGIGANGTTGEYGAFSMCAAEEQLSWAFNALYQQQTRENSANTDACDFSGNATSQNANLPSGCSKLVDQAGAAGTGTVTSVPTGTGAGAAGAASSSSGVAVPLVLPAWDLKVVSVGVYVSVAALAGAGMVLL